MKKPTRRLTIVWGAIALLTITCATIFTKIELDAFLINAVKKADSKSVGSLLDDGANPNACESHWVLPPKTVSQLQFDLSINSNRFRSASAIQLAAHYPNEGSVMAVLIKHGVNVNQVGEYSTTPLDRAVFYGNSQSVRELLHAGAHIRTSPSSYSTVSRLCSGMLVWRPNYSSSFDPGGDRDYAGVIATLADHGIDIDSKGDLGDTMLIEAIRAGNSEAAKVLLLRHADINIKGYKGRTAYYYARASGQKELMDLVLPIDSVTKASGGGTSRNRLN